MSSLRQLSALMWKNWLIRTRNLCLSITEFILPMLFVWLIAVIPTPKEASDSEIHFNNETYDYQQYRRCDGKPSCASDPYPLYINKSILEQEKNYYGIQNYSIKVFYSPVNSFTNDLMHQFKDLTGADLFQRDQPEDVINEIKGLVHKYNEFSDSDKQAFGFIFEALPTNGSTTFDYRFINLRNFEQSLKRVYGRKGDDMTKDDHWLYNYRYRFCKFQILLNEALLNKLTNDRGIRKNETISWIEKTNPEFSVIQHNPLPMLLPLILYGYILMSMVIVQRLTEEKSQRVRELLRILGVKEWVYWSSHFFNYFAIIVIQSIFSIFILVYWQISRLTRINPIIFFVVFNLFGAQLILLFMLVSIFFDKPKMAKYCAMTIFMALFFMPYLGSLLGSGRPVWMIVSAVLGQIAFTSELSIITQILWEQSVDFGFAQLFESTKQYKPINVFYIMIVQILSIPLYCFLIWYLDAVVPSKYGITKPLLFPCKSSKKRKRVQMKLQTESNKNYETEPDRNAMITLDKVTKVFKGGKGIFDISLNIFEGQITGLLGHNGAGKTTTMNIITGLYRPDSGITRINGYDIVTDTERARKGLGLCPQESIFLEELKVREHLKLFAWIAKDNWKVEEIDEVVDLIRMGENQHKVFSELSGGMKKKLTLGIGLISGAEILILDEPTSGMDPETTRDIWEVLQVLKKRITMLLTTHNMQEADILSDRIVIMSDGKLKCCGSPLFLKKRFGAGYHLRVLKSNNFNKELFDSTLQRHFPDSRVQSELGIEIIYLLESEDQLKQTDKDLFSNLFDELDIKKFELGINSYGISVTSMEDVFIKISSDDKEKDNFKKSVILIRSDYKKLKGWDLYFSRIIGLLLKRWHFFCRDWEVFFSLFFILPIMMAIMLVIDDIFLNSNESQKLRLDLHELYGNTIGFYGSKDTVWQNFAVENYAPNARRHGMETIRIKSQDPIEWLINIANKVGREEYEEKYIIGGIVNAVNGGFDLEFWWNIEAIHSLPISINVMYESLIGYFVPDFKNQMTITTRNEPQRFQTNILSISISFYTHCSLFMPFLSVILVSALFVYPFMERLSKSKFLQLMTGVSDLTYWMCNVLADLLTVGLAVVVIIVVILLLDSKGILSDLDSIAALVLLFIALVISCAPIAYSMTLFFKNRETDDIYVVVILAMYAILFQQSLGVTLVTIFLNDEDKANDFIDHGLGVNGWVYNIAKVIAPIFTFNFAYSKLHLIGSVKSFCRDFETKTNLTERCSERSKDFIFCCDYYCDTFICPKSRPLSLENAGIFVELILMMVSALIFWSLLIYLDRNYSQEQSSSSEEHKKFADLQKDNDVIEEEMKVNRIIREERSKEEAMVVTKLTKYYRTVLAVNRLSFAVHKNECFGLLGVNGAGKTTTFSMLTGEITPNDGNAYIDGLDLKSKKKSYQKRIGYCPQTDPLLEFMTANEMLYLFGRLRGIPKQYLKTEVEAIIQTTDIEKYAKTISEHYSGGTKRKLSLGISIIGSPELVFLDEPTAGVDPIARGRIWKALNVLKSSKNSSIILTSHSMEESEALCSRVAIMVRGEFKCLGSIQHLKTKYGKGFTLQIKLKAQYITEKEYIEKVKKFISERLPSAQLTDSHECLLHYELSDTSVKWSTMFRVMQTGAQELDLEDYTLSDTTLEQIFISFARQK